MSNFVLPFFLCSVYTYIALYSTLVVSGNTLPTCRLICKNKNNNLIVLNRRSIFLRYELFRIVAQKI